MQVNHLLTSDPVRVSEVSGGRPFYSNYFVSLMTLTLPSKRIWLDTGNAWGINMTASKRMTFPVAGWRHNLKLSNFRHTQQHKVCTDGIRACIEYCCEEQLSCHCTHAVCNNVCTVDKEWPMMDRRTLSSEREHEDTLTVVPHLQLSRLGTAVYLWPSFFVGRAMAQAGSLRPLTAETRVRAFSNPREDLF
jgi:hypothetical protein